MTLKTFTPLVAATLLLGPLNAPAAAESSDSAHQVARTSDQQLVRPPPGFTEACQRYAWLCENRPSVADNTTSADILELAREINRSVNLAVTKIPDPENYGRADHWTLPGWRGGDCEDFVLAKYKRLLDAGVDGRDLSIAVVQTSRQENHAVLVLHHESGDLVLDSLNSRILPWNETSYRYLAMQTREDQSAWDVVADQPKDSVMLAQR